MSSSLMESIEALLDVFGLGYPDSECTCSEELQFQEVVRASLQHMPSTSKQSSSSSSSSQICCEICFDDKQSHEMFRTKGCSHSFCSTCISRHVESKLQENIINISCPGVDCKNMFEPESLKSVAPPHVIARWELQLSESTILPSQKYYCPYTDCAVVLINDEEGVTITQSECPNCWRLFCAKCRVPWHQGYSCSEFKRSKQDKRGAKEFRSLAKRNKWKKCPKCRYYVEKSEGCIHITCRCKFEFCYICGSSWNETHFTTCQGS